MRESIANLRRDTTSGPVRGTPQREVDGALHAAAGRRPGTGVWRPILARAGRALRSIPMLMREGRVRRMALRELMAADERVLRDLGVSRSALPGLVRGTWFDEPQGPAGRSAAQRTFRRQWWRLGTAATAMRRAGRIA